MPTHRFSHKQAPSCSRLVLVLQSHMTFSCLKALRVKSCLEALRVEASLQPGEVKSRHNSPV
jgi:hypothetical protein